MNYRKYKNIFLINSFVLVLLAVFVLPIFGGIARAANCDNGIEVPAGADPLFCKNNDPDGNYCEDGTFIPVNVIAPNSEAAYCKDHGGFAPKVSTDVRPKFAKNDCKGDNIQAGKPQGDENHCGILDYLTLLIKVLSGLVGIIVTAMIIVGGIQYSTSGGDGNAVSAAKKRIFNAILALVLYIFIFAFLQYLIPGGVL